MVLQSRRPSTACPRPRGCAEMGPPSPASLYRHHLQKITKVLGSPHKNKKGATSSQSTSHRSSRAGIVFGRYLERDVLFPLRLKSILALCGRLSSWRRMLWSTERWRLQRSTQSSGDASAVSTSWFWSRFTAVTNPSCKDPSQTPMSTVSFCCSNFHFS